MSITRQIELAIGGALLFIILCLWVMTKWTGWHRDTLKEENQVLNADSSADTTYVREYKRVIIEEKQAHEQVESAIRRNPEWSEQPLPADVADILRDPQATTPGVPR